MIDPNKWNAAIDIVDELLRQRLTPDLRAAARDEKCCHEVDLLKTDLLRTINEWRLPTP